MVKAVSGEVFSFWSVAESVSDPVVLSGADVVSGLGGVSCVIVVDSGDGGVFSSVVEVVSGEVLSLYLGRWPV